MTGEPVVLELNDEASAVAALRGILDGLFEDKSLTLDFSNADWLNFSLTLKGGVFHQSLTSAAMKGLIEFQNAIFRSVALITHDSARINTLTEEERSKFELIFKVKEGSSEVSADAKDNFIDLASRAIGKMSGKLVYASILTLAIGYFGNESYKAYLGSTVDIKKVEADIQKSSVEKERQEDITKLATTILERGKEEEEVLSDAVKSSEKIAKIMDERDKAFEAIVRGSEKSDGIDIQGLSIPSPVVEELNRSSRTRGRDVTFDTMFRVLAVDSSNKGSFNVKLLRSSDGLVQSASLENSIRAERYHRAIQRAEWKKSTVRVKVRARKFGDEDYRDAEIDSASTPRSQ